MEQIIDVEKWLSQPPLPEEIFSLQADGTGKYIPYDIIVEKLYQLCGHDWSTYNFKETYVLLPNKQVLVTGNINIIVNYKLSNGDKIARRLAGAANYIINNSKIPHTTASVKSMAVMNGVKPLGKQFGWLLNAGEENVTPQNDTVDLDETKRKDEEMQAQYLPIEAKLKSFKYQEEAAEYLQTTEFKFFVPAKQLVNSKPLKNK